MENNGDYNARLTSPFYDGEVIVGIEKDRLDFQAANTAFSLNFATIEKMAAENFRLRLPTAAGAFELSQLGYGFAGFCEELNLAFCSRSLEALFVEGTPLIEAEGEYAYEDLGATAAGAARIRIFEDSVCILPADEGGRRIPFCFLENLTRENYTLKLTLDTAERYELIRLGSRTDSFYDQLQKGRKKAKELYNANLARIAKEEERYQEETMQRLSVLRAVCGEAQLKAGCFAPMRTATDEFLPAWYVALGRDRAAVELVTAENTATYLYRFSEDPNLFLCRLRHAMEAVGDHREVIYLPEITAEATPLYAMAVKRITALGFLRGAMVGRLIHHQGWPEKLAAFFST